MERNKIEVHYTGLDRDRFRPLGHSGLRARLGEALGLTLPENQPLLATIGALIARKGQDLAIGALAALPDAQLLLVGKGDDEAHLRRLAADLRVADRVHFLGSVDHDVLPLILSAADAMVLPTRSEGLANAWVEALACGTPVVTTGVGGARELLRSPEAGVLVERNAEAVASGVRQVLARRAPRDSVAALVAGFDWTEHAARLAGIYARLADGGSVR